MFSTAGCPHNRVLTHILFSFDTYLSFSPPCQDELAFELTASLVTAVVTFGRGWAGLTAPLAPDKQLCSHDLYFPLTCPAALAK